MYTGYTEIFTKYRHPKYQDANIVLDVFCRHYDLNMYELLQMLQRHNQRFKQCFFYVLHRTTALNYHDLATTFNVVRTIVIRYISEAKQLLKKANPTVEETVYINDINNIKKEVARCLHFL